MPGTILILDSVATNRIIVQVKLRQARFGVVQAGTVVEAVDVAVLRAPDLILIGDSVEGGGALACARLRNLPHTAQTPIIIAAHNIDQDLRMRCITAGADALIEKPMNETLLLARIRNLMRRSGELQDLAERPGARLALGLAEAPAVYAGGSRIGLIQSTARTDPDLRAALKAHRHSLTPLTPADLEQECAGYDAFLIDLGPGKGAATLKLLSELQSRSETRRAVHLCIVQDEDDEAAVMALDLGADDVIRPTPPATELAIRLSKCLRHAAELERLANELDAGVRLSVTDALTGLFNRRYAMREIARASDSNAGFAVIAVDVDRFKDVNDSYGHAAGDVVLREISSRMRRCLRRGDTLARIGGEEFLAILPGVSTGQARRLADRMRRAVSDQPVDLPGEAGCVTVTISLGLFAETEDRLRPCSAEACMQSADRALYASKGAGRNQVTLAQMSAV